MTKENEIKIKMKKPKVYNRIGSEKEQIEFKLALWLYYRGFLGLVGLAFAHLFGDAEEIGKKIYKEIFKK